MIQAQNFKYVNCIPPGAILDDTSATVAAIDTLGFDHLTVLFSLGATDIDAVAMSLTDCATSGGSYDAITSTAASGTTGDGRIPQDDDDNKIFMISLPLTGIKRYVKPVFTAGNGSAGTYVSALAILEKAEQVPYSSTTRGLGGQIIVP